MFIKSVGRLVKLDGKIRKVVATLPLQSDGGEGSLNTWAVEQLVRQGLSCLSEYSHLIGIFVVFASQQSSSGIIMDTDNTKISSSVILV